MHRALSCVVLRCVAAPRSGVNDRGMVAPFCLTVHAVVRFSSPRCIFVRRASCFLSLTLHLGLRISNYAARRDKSHSTAVAKTLSRPVQLIPPSSPRPLNTGGLALISVDVFFGDNY